MASLSRRQFVRIGAISAWGLSSAGCGSILYPNRIGQPPGPLDWKVVALDTIGLLFFLVPGVIAFAVDFVNGTIYLPQPYYGNAPHQQPPMVSIKVPKHQLNQTGIEQALTEHQGQNVRLVPGNYRVQRIESLAQFWSVREAMADDPTTGSTLPT